MLMHGMDEIRALYSNLETFWGLLTYNEREGGGEKREESEQNS